MTSNKHPEIYICINKDNQTMKITEVDNIVSSISKYINELTSEYVSIYIFGQEDPIYYPDLVTAIITKLELDTIKKLAIHINTKFETNQYVNIKAINDFAVQIVKKYHEIERIRVMFDLNLSDSLSDNKFDIAKKLCLIHRTYVKLWVNINPDNIKNLQNIIDKLESLELLQRTFIYIDTHNYSTQEILVELKHISINTSMILVENYIRATNRMKNAEVMCCDPTGQLVNNCENHLFARRRKNMLDSIDITLKLMKSAGI